MNYFAVLSILALCVGTSALAFPERKSEIETALNAKVSLAAAIAAAQAAAGSGVPIFANTETKHGVTNYEIQVIDPPKRRIFIVDPQSGHVTQSEESIPDLRDLAYVAIIRDAKVNLAGAVQAAEASGGRAMEAELEKRQGNYSYKINIVDPDYKREVLIDLKTGYPLPEREVRQYRAH